MYLENLCPIIQIMYVGSHSFHDWFMLIWDPKKLKHSRYIAEKVNRWSVRIFLKGHPFTIHPKNSLNQPSKHLLTDLLIDGVKSRNFPDPHPHYALLFLIERAARMVRLGRCGTPGVMRRPTGSTGGQRPRLTGSSLGAVQEEVQPQWHHLAASCKCVCACVSVSLSVYQFSVCALSS